MHGQVISACLAGDLATASQLFGMPIPEEFLDHPSSLRFNLEQLTADPDYLPWSARAIILDKAMIGMPRFHSRPDPEYLRAYAPNAPSHNQLHEPTPSCPGQRVGYVKKTLT